MARSSKWIQAEPDECLVDVARRTLREKFERVQQYLPLAAFDWKEEIENVHQLRVSSRRAQAALAIYRELIPEWRAVWMEKQLKRIRVASNGARDDDVFIQHLEKDDQNDGALKLAKRVRAHRVEAQQSIVEIHDRLQKKRRFDRRIDKLIKRTRLRGKKNKAKKPSFADWARMKFAAALDDFFKAAECDYSDVEALHQMRITGKKVRYAMELLAGAFPEQFRNEAYSELEKLQDKLGKVNDHFVAINRIEFWVHEAASGKKLEVRYLQQILSEEERLLKETRNEFLDWWNKKREAKFLKRFHDAVKDSSLMKPK